VAAVGLVHRSAQGGLAELCGDRGRPLLVRPYPEDSATSSVPFFGLMAKGGLLVAVGLDGLYRVSERGVERDPLPAFKDVGGITVSFEAAELALVMTGVNARKALSGLVPMLAPGR
jgi:hypothetical protein